MNAVARTLGVWILAGAALVAADFWDEKDFTTWSDKEVEKMLTDSPWSKEVRVPLSGPRASGIPIRPGGIGIGGGGGGRRGGSAFSSAPARLALTVSWRSALPLKQAFVRRETPVDVRLGPEAHQFLEQDEPFYIVSVSGLPNQFARVVQSPDSFETVLKLDRRDPISPERTDVFREGEGLTILWFFPRTAAITLDDKDVEFISSLGQLEVKKKFKLEDMVFGGELEL